MRHDIDIENDSMHPTENHNTQNIKTISFLNALLIPELVKIMDEGHTITITPKGVSMRPFLESQRDKAVLKKATNPQVGDVVLAEVSPRRYVLHRIIKISDSIVTLRGDGNIGVEMCHVKDVKAVAIGFYRKGRETLDRTDGRKWKIYSWAWTKLFPIRRYLIGAYKKIWIPIFGAI